MHTQGLAVPVVDAWLMQAFASEDFTGGSDCVELVGLRAIFGRSLVGSVELDDPLARTCECGGQPSSVAGGAFDCPRSFARFGVSLGPVERFGVAVAGCRESGRRDHAGGAGLHDGVGSDAGAIYFLPAGQ